MGPELPCAIRGRHLGQVSTEYLVILAVVLVVALIVAWLLGGIAPVGNAVDESQSKNYWLSTTPISVSAWKFHGYYLDLTLQNVGRQKVTVYQLSIDGSPVFSTNTTLAGGETKTMTAATGSGCGSSGESFELQNVSIYYSMDNMSGLLEKGEKSMVGKCS